MKKFLLCAMVVALFTNANAQTIQQIENEAAFTKLYGYVRYFYPGDEAAAIDWDKFAIYGSKKVDACTTPNELKTTLISLFKPIAPSIQIGGDNDNITFDRTLITPANLHGYKTIAWQHIGVGLLRDRRSLYKSARTNRPVVYPAASPTFGSMSTIIDGAAYRGKTFKLTGKAKMADGEGTGHFWVRVDRADKKFGFFDNMDARPITTTDWGNFEIAGTIDTNADKINIGIFLQGAGEFWVDDFTFSINEDGKWVQVYANNLNSAKTGVSSTANILSGNPNLKVLPAPNPAYIYSVVQDNNAPDQKWASIKSKSADDDIEAHTKYFPEYPQVGEYVNKSIGSGLKVVIPLALYGDDAHTYPAADSAKFGQLISDLKSIKRDSINGNNLYTRLADIAISWNVFQHFFPYFDFAQTDWQKDLKDALTDAHADKDGADFQKTLQKMTAKLKDGHIGVNWRASTNYYLPPLTWEWVQGKLVITHVLNNTVNLHQGDVVTTINGQDPGAYFDNAKQYISAATPGYLDYRVQRETLLGANGSTLSLTVIDSNNAKHDVTLNRDLSYMTYYNSLPRPDSIKTISNDVMYLNIGTIHMQTINAALPQLEKCKAIICDLRGYPNNTIPFIQYLMTIKDTVKDWMRVPHIIYPDQEKIVGYENYGWEIPTLGPHLKAKIIFITDGEDISYAESYMGFIEHYKLATIIGQPTAGTNGNVNFLQLPGGYSFNWTDMKVLKLDGSQHHGIGTKPDIYLTKTIKGVRENRDEFLDKAIEMVNGYSVTP